MLYWSNLFWNYFLNVIHCYVTRSISHLSYVNGKKVAPLEIVNMSQAALATLQVFKPKNILTCDEVNAVAVTELHNRP
ncbi:hypothetical protein PR048_013983 [Dryococelus australis]|uniref:Uncharacterized protein n=1 Tax=Dryococelus australis TaxID=614101 RepID=A0ABQ9HU09_9NEOP|nr:hypothetical protein PR048_013983 [Dryococelus australis]